MFTRDERTYDFDPKIPTEILKDECGPLNRIARLIPDGATILDVGAGNGLLAAVLCQLGKKVTIDGIEPNEFAAMSAAGQYRKFYKGYAQDFANEIKSENYDYVVLADVIEHVQDPFTFLKDLLKLLPPSARIIISTPNIAFGTVRLSLLYGEFDYVDSGLLEKTHVRFFTLRTLRRMVSELGLHIEKLYLLQRSLLETETDISKFPVNLWTISSLLRDELASTYQFLLILSRQSAETEELKFGKRLSLRRYLVWRVAVALRRARNRLKKAPR